MQSSNIILVPSTFLANMFVSFAYSIAQACAEFFWITHIKTAASLAEFYGNTLITIDTIIAPHYQTISLGYKFSTTRTWNLYRMIMSIIFPSHSSVRLSPFPRTFHRTKIMFHAFYMPVLSFKFLSTIFTDNFLLFINLKMRPVAGKKFALSPSLVKFIKRLSAATRTLNNWIIYHRTSVSQNINISKTKLGNCWRCLNDV